MKNSILLAFVSMLQMASAVPAWSDIFTSLKPYEDPNEADAFDFEEVGDPRFGIVQLSTSSTTYNATLNLTGHILLGLGIASSVLLYMFFQAFKKSDSGGYEAPSDGYGKRSVFDEAESEEMLLTRIPELLHVIDNQMKDFGLDEEDCRLWVSCEARRQANVNNNNKIYNSVDKDSKINNDNNFVNNIGNENNIDNYNNVDNEDNNRKGRDRKGTIASFKVTISDALNEIFRNVNEKLLQSDEMLRNHHAASNGDEDCKIKFRKCKFELDDIRKIMIKNLI